MANTTTPFTTADILPRSGELIGTLSALILATGMEQWTGAGLNVVLPDLTGTLSASVDESSWALTIYTLAFAVSVLSSHRLAGYLGNRHLLVGSCLLFATASLGCAASPTLALFLFFRVLLGFAGGAFLVRTLVFVTQRFAPKERVTMLRIYAVGFFIIGRLIAPITAGWLADNLSWRVLFLLNIPVILLAAWLFHRYAEHYWREDAEHHGPDILGLILILAGVTAFQIVLSRGEIDDWFSSSFICTMTLVGISGNVLFIAWQFASWNKHPLLHLPQLRQRGLFSAAVLGIALGMLLGGSLYALPQYLRRVESHSALQTGQLVSISGIGSIAALLIMPTVARMIGVLGSKVVMATALVAQIISMVMMERLLTVNTPDHSLWLPLLLNGIFVGIAVPALALGAFAGMHEGLASSARAIYYGARQLGASLGVTFAVILVDRREALHSSRLLEGLFTRNLSTIGTNIDPDNAVGMKALAGGILRQSLVLTYADVFYAMAALAAAMLCILPLLPPLHGATQIPAPPADLALDSALGLNGIGVSAP